MLLIYLMVNSEMATNSIAVKDGEKALWKKNLYFVEVQKKYFKTEF